MKITNLLIGAALAATIPATAANNYFVVYDNFLRAPAYCYKLPSGWTGVGWIQWEIPYKLNPVVESIILMNPAEHRIVQKTTSINQGSFALQQVGNIYSDANAMAAYQAQQINSTIVVPGLANFRPKYGRFSDDVPPETLKVINLAFSFDRTAQFKKAFKVECFFDCEYNGAKCEALYEFVCAFTATQVRPNLPTIASVVEHNRFFTIAPPGEIAATKKIGGRLFAGVFVNRLWKCAEDRMIAAMIEGKMIGMNEGMDLMRQSQAENQRIMDDVRRRWSEVIREVKTVDNPLSPGDKIERPIYFDHSLINSRQDALIMSDRTIEPHEAEKLIGQGFWTAVD
ncbi:MAG: hypothetical protein K6F50_07750 [Kiritimatiellae bacterium]|nr:hypothetical protein [Kiritimatiellia bacterium]